MATDSPREQVSELAHSASEAAQQTMSRQKDHAASNLGNFAGALRKAAQESDADGQGLRPIAEWAADRLDRASSALRERDLGSMLRGTEDFARRQPVAFFFAAATAGFLATRFLKAGVASDERPDFAKTGDGRPDVPDLPPHVGPVSTPSADIPPAAPM